MVLGVDPSNDADFTVTQNIENPNPENLTEKGTEFAKKILNPSNPDKITDETAENFINPAGSGSQLEDSDGDGYADNFLGVSQNKAEEITGSFGQDPSNFEQDTRDKIQEAFNKLSGDVKDGALSGAENSIFSLPGSGLAGNINFPEGEDSNSDGLPDINPSIPGLNILGGEAPDINLNPFSGLRETLEYVLIGIFGFLILREVLKYAE